MARFIALPNLLSSFFVLGYVAFIFHLVYRTDDILIGKLPENLQKCKFLWNFQWQRGLKCYFWFVNRIRHQFSRFGQHSETIFSIFNETLNNENSDILVIAREEAFTYAIFAFVAAFHAMTALVTFIIADVKQLRLGINNIIMNS